MKDISYCINALCDNRENEGYMDSVCQSCNASLLVNNKYRLIKKISPKDKRIMVYEAINILNGERNIIKINEMHTNNVTNHLMRELNILSCFPSNYFPRNITSEDYFEWNPIPTIKGLKISGLVLPRIIGSNSYEWIILNGPINQDKAIIWMQNILQYVKKLHEFAYLHRDIKPSNIMVALNTEKLTLIDYETCRKMDDEYMTIISGNIVNKKLGKYHYITRVFSPGYTAPEQNNGRAIPQSDFFSLGRTVLFWLTGQSPYDLINHDSNKIDWSKFPTPLNQCFKDFLDQLTHPNPIKRFITIEELENELNYELALKIKQETKKNSKIQKILQFLLKFSLLFGIVTIIWSGITRWFQQQGVDALIDGNLNQAKKEFLKSIKINPWDKKNLFYLGTVCQALNDSNCAETSYKKVLNINPKSSRALYHLGVVKQNQGKYEEAKTLYLKSLDIKPTPETYNQLARYYLKKKNFFEAQKYVDLGIRIATDKDMISRLYYHQGRIYYDQEEWKLAEDFLSLAEQSNETAEALCLLAKTQEKLNRPQIFINAFWYRCFYADNQYPEGNDFKENIINRALSQEVK